jgi:hypothetical protein
MSTRSRQRPIFINSSRWTWNMRAWSWHGGVQLGCLDLKYSDWELKFWDEVSHSQSNRSRRSDYVLRSIIKKKKILVTWLSFSSAITKCKQWDFSSRKRYSLIIECMFSSEGDSG